ncbi:MAG: hypothetical protein JXB39_05200 [Deltaproteobacteria bacterium]|nr:hypothetical protein [Deltaproteobacteria bacterium]
MRIFKIIGWIALGTAGLAALAGLLGLVVMLLWNWLMPAIFGLPVLTWLQAVGLLVLCHVLFKGVHGHGDRHPITRRSHGPFARAFAHRVRTMVSEPKAGES